MFPSQFNRKSISKSKKVSFNMLSSEHKIQEYVVEIDDHKKKIIQSIKHSMNKVKQVNKKCRKIIKGKKASEEMLDSSLSEEMIEQTIKIANNCINQLNSNDIKGHISN